MKKFLVIGNANAITYKEVFPSIANGEIFVRTAKGTVDFAMNFTNNNGENKKISSVWFTTLDSRHLYKTLELTKTYDPEKYPVYDNYNAIEVSCVKNIPKDYKGVMGVPISIVLFSPEQFEVLACSAYSDAKYYGNPPLYVNGNKKYVRILIRLKKKDGSPSSRTYPSSTFNHKK